MPEYGAMMDFWGKSFQGPDIAGVIERKRRGEKQDLLFEKQMKSLDLSAKKAQMEIEAAEDKAELGRFGGRWISRVRPWLATGDVDGAMAEIEKISTELEESDISSEHSRAILQQLGDPNRSPEDRLAFGRKIDTEIEAEMIRNDLLEPQKEGEFERLLRKSTYKSDEKEAIRKQRINSMAQGEGFTLVSDGKGGLIMAKGPGSMTAVQQGKAKNEYINREIGSRKFISLSNKMVDRITAAGEADPKLGVTGAIARMGDEILSAWENIKAATGVTVDPETSLNLDDYDLGKMEKIASDSAAFKTNVLSLALIYASAAGLGEGRALTNKDLQRALTAIGGSTNSPAQFKARINEVQDSLDMALRVESRVRGYEGYESILERRSEEGLIKGTTYTDANGNKSTYLGGDPSEAESWEDVNGI